MKCKYSFLDFTLPLAFRKSGRTLRLNFHLCTAIFAAAFLIGCRTGPHDEFRPPGPGGGVSRVTISVTDSAGVAVSGAAVYFGGTLYESGEGGIVSVGAVKDGVYQISVDHPGYFFHSSVVTIPGGDFTLEVPLSAVSTRFAVRRILPALGNAPPDQNGRFVAEFNLPIDPASAGPIEFEPDIGDFEISVTASTLEAAFELEWPAGQIVRWRIPRTVRSINGEELENSYVGQFRVSPIDLTPPRLVRSTPANGATNVFRNQTVTLVFSDEIDASSAGEGSVQIEPPISIRTEVSQNRMLLIHDELFRANTAYTITISGLRDSSQNLMLGSAAFSFTTGTELRRARHRNPDWTRIGDRIVFESDSDGSFDIWQIKADGSELAKLTESDGNDLHPRFSYDGSQVVFERRVGDHFHLFRLDIRSGVVTQVTSGNDNYRSPVYSPTFERRITFVSDRSDRNSLWVSEDDGSAPREWIPGFGRDPSFPAYHPFQETIIVFSAYSGLSQDIYKASGFPGDSATEWKNLTDELLSDETSPDFAPEGDVIAFISDAGGTKNIWLTDFEGSFPRQLTFSEVNLDRPVYSPNFGQREILAEVHLPDNSIALAFFDALSGEQIRYLVGGDD